MNVFKPLNESFIPLYNSHEGRKYSTIKICHTIIHDVLHTERVYNETLESVKQSFPQYINELQGIADGSQVEFYKVSCARDTIF